MRLTPGEYVYDWFDTLNANGYTAVYIAYRQGMKGYKMGKGLSGLAKSSKQFYLSQQMAVEDLFDAVRYLIRNREQLQRDPLPEISSQGGRDPGARCRRSARNKGKKGV